MRRVAARVRRRLACLGLAGTASDEGADPLKDESVALAGLSQAAILGRAALGPRAGRGEAGVTGELTGFVHLAVRDMPRSRKPAEMLDDAGISTRHIVAAARQLVAVGRAR